MSASRRPNPRSCPCHVDLAPARSHMPECQWHDPSLVLCPVCGGCGTFFNGFAPCSRCKGLGEITQGEAATVKQPHGCLMVGQSPAC